MYGLGFVVPELGDQARSLPQPQFIAHLTDEDEGDEAQIHALVNQINDRVNPDECEDIENKSADKEKDIAIPLGPLPDLHEGHSAYYNQLVTPVYAIGHSNRTLEFFVGLLLGYQIERLVDVRTVPRSRHNPQFNRETLPADLKNVGIAYTHMSGLGGLRHARKDSINTGWQNASFRGFADYMQTPEFEENLQKLIALSKKETVAIMCAEAVPWRCHRSLIADALTVRGIRVYQIMSRVSSSIHQITPWAQVDGKRVTYPTRQAELKL